MKTETPKERAVWIVRDHFQIPAEVALAPSQTRLVG